MHAGDPRRPSSLHYINPHQPNEYLRAIDAVGRVVLDYDSDKLVPVLGFGGKLPDGSVSHNFALNGQGQNPYCAGLEGVVAAYKQAFSSVQLYGPTNFAPIIQQTAAMARDNANAYHILLILTDGIISDMDATMRAIIEVCAGAWRIAVCHSCAIQASGLALSIIIIGVGGEWPLISCGAI